MNIGLLYKDDNILVVSKPCEMEFDGFVKNLNPVLYDKGIVLTSHVLPIYILDKSTRGIAVFALNEKTRENLHHQVKIGDFCIEYRAVTVGEPKDNYILYNAFAKKDAKTGLYRQTPQLNEGVQEISLNYQVLQKVDLINLVKIKTGLIEQEKIRFAMADLQNPIFGDSLYKGDTLAKNTYLALNLSDVRFINPETNEVLAFKLAPLDRKPWTYFQEEKIFRE